MYSIYETDIIEPLNGKSYTGYELEDENSNIILTANNINAIVEKLVELGLSKKEIDEILQRSL